MGEPTEDFAAQLVELLSGLPPEEWKQAIHDNFGGRSRYIYRTPPERRAVVRELVEAGVPERTARRKANGR